jgi:hypothetical protein
MKALFADISERARQRNKDVYAYRVHERRQVLALCDAVQIAVAKGQHDRVNMLLKEMHAIVDPALARRSGVPLRISA